MTNDIKFVSEGELKNHIRKGELIRCTREEYIGGIRDMLHKIAAQWVEQNQGIVASITLQEVKRLDKRFDLPEDATPQGSSEANNDEMPPVSGITFDSHDVWPEEPQCFYQPCNDPLVLILVTQQQANENDWTKARFFCGAHAQGIHVHMTSTLQSGHIVGVVKEPTWDMWEARDTDA